MARTEPGKKREERNNAANGPIKNRSGSTGEERGLTRLLGTKSANLHTTFMQTKKKEKEPGSNRR